MGQITCVWCIIVKNIVESGRKNNARKWPKKLSVANALKLIVLSIVLIKVGSSTSNKEKRNTNIYTDFLFPWNVKHVLLI